MSTARFRIHVWRRVRRQRGKRVALSKYGRAPVARARLLKPGFFTNEQLAELPPFGRLLFAGLWTLADRKGRLPDIPKVISGSVFPFDKVPVERLLDMLAERAFILRYAVDGKRYIQVVKFETHQHVHKNEADSIIPAPNGWDDSDTLVRQIPSIGEPITGARPAEANSTPKAEAEAKAEATSRRERLKATYALTEGEWQQLFAKHQGVNVGARYWEFLDWIGESEELRRPKKGTFVAFDGFLSVPNRTLREVQAPYGETNGAIKVAAAVNREAGIR